MYKQFKISEVKKGEEKMETKEEEILSELKHKFNISFLICGCLVEREREAGFKFHQPPFLYTLLQLDYVFH